MLDTFILGSNNFTHLREMQTYVHINNLNMHVIHDSQKQETTQMSLSWWADKQNVVYSYNGILFIHNRNEVLIHTT